MKRWFSLLFFVILAVSATNGIAANCTVKDADIAAEYSGDCLNGLANGEGIAIGRDKYVGQFRDGEIHGRGVYTWADGSQYDGEYRDGKRSGFGVLRLVRGDESIQSLESRGQWIGDHFVVQGMSESGYFSRICTSIADCKNKERGEYAQRMGFTVIPEDAYVDIFYSYSKFLLKYKKSIIKDNHAKMTMDSFNGIIERYFVKEVDTGDVFADKRAKIEIDNKIDRARKMLGAEMSKNAVNLNAMDIQLTTLIHFDTYDFNKEIALFNFIEETIRDGKPRFVAYDSRTFYTDPLSSGKFLDAIKSAAIHFGLRLKDNSPKPLPIFFKFDAKKFSLSIPPHVAEDIVSKGKVEKVKYISFYDNPGSRHGSGKSVNSPTLFKIQFKLKPRQPDINTFESNYMGEFFGGFKSLSVLIDPVEYRIYNYNTGDLLYSGKINH
ncbi:MAG: hypothetical protein WA056_11440 [Gallionella sp.]